MPAGQGEGRAGQSGFFCSTRCTAKEFEPVSITGERRMGEGFCCPARQKSQERNPLWISRFFNKAGRQKTRPDGVRSCECRFQKRPQGGPPTKAAILHRGRKSHICINIQAVLRRDRGVQRGEASPLYILSRYRLPPVHPVRPDPPQSGCPHPGPGVFPQCFRIPAQCTAHG